MRPLVVALLVSSLGLPAACGPSVDPAYKADLDRRLAQLPTSEETFPPSESFLPMAFAVGQWTQHRVRDDKGVTALLTYKLVGQEEGGYWLETVSETYLGREAAKMHLALLGGRDPSGVDIRALKVKKGKGPPVAVDAGDLLAARQKYRAVLDLLAVSFEAHEKDDARVPGGHFIGCWTTETAQPWGPWQTAPSTQMCIHPSVPLSGVVRARPVGGVGLMELVAFGLDGAESEF